MIRTYPFCACRRRSSPCLSALFAFLLVLVSLNGTAATAVATASLTVEKPATPDKVSRSAVMRSDRENRSAASIAALAGTDPGLPAVAAGDAVDRAAAHCRTGVDPQIGRPSAIAMLPPCRAPPLALRLAARILPA